MFTEACRDALPHRPDVREYLQQAEAQELDAEQQVNREPKVRRLVPLHSEMEADFALCTIFTARPGEAHSCGTTARGARGRSKGGHCQKSAVSRCNTTDIY